MIYDGIITKPSLDELYHEKTHKYVSKYKNAKGKWVYSYNKTKSKLKKVNDLKEKHKPQPAYTAEQRLIIKGTVRAIQGMNKTHKALKKIKRYSKYGRYTKSGNRRV